MAKGLRERVGKQYKGTQRTRNAVHGECTVELAKWDTVARAPGCPQKTFIVQFGSEPLSQEGNPMFGPGEYRPDPSAGITAPADLPQPEIVLYSRNDLRRPCPRCG